MHPPYIGITGFMRKIEVEAALQSLKPGRHKLMVGVLASGKTLNGIPNEWRRRYRMPEGFANIFVEHERALNLIHFNTRERKLYPVLEKLALARAWAGRHCHGFQLNMTWPNPEILAALRLMPQAPVVVLQIGSDAFKEVDCDPLRVAHKVATQYASYVDYVLIDKSGGFGKALDASFTLHCLNALAAATQGSIGLGVAGGLGGGNVRRLLDPIADKHPQVSIDAQGRLRNENDDLDMTKVLAYIRSAQKVLA